MAGEDPDIFDELFGNELTPVAPAQPPNLPAPAQVLNGEASVKLGRNLDLALDRQLEILAQPITPETDAREKRLIGEVAHQTVRAAVSVDEHRFKREQKDDLSEVLDFIAREKARRAARIIEADGGEES